VWRLFVSLDIPKMIAFTFEIAEHMGDFIPSLSLASANRSTACCNARMAARHRSHRSVPLIERNRALELRSTPARHPGPQVTKH